MKSICQSYPGPNPQLTLDSFDFWGRSHLWIISGTDGTFLNHLSNSPLQMWLSNIFLYLLECGILCIMTAPVDRIDSSIRC